MSQPNILGTWYADPLSPEQARRLLTRCEHRERIRQRHGGSIITSRLQKMIARFWLGEEIYDDYLMLKPAASRSAHGQVLLELVYGQLLLSRKVRKGITHLDKAFRLAPNLFAAADYLRVMNRLRLLKHLPLSAAPAKAESLESLLTAAKVIERMQQSENTRPVIHHDPKDTYG